jgi:hypothetical protein
MEGQGGGKAQGVADPKRKKKNLGGCSTCIFASLECRVSSMWEMQMDNRSQW